MPNSFASKIFWISIIVGSALRLWLSQLGYNFDIDSYWIVSDLCEQGKSVYAETSRYNYGPIWFYMLWGARRITTWMGQIDIQSFHLIVCILLTAVDTTIACILKRRYGIGSALFFFLNPISLLITGFHSQFDNFAILIALVACSYPTLNRRNRRAEYASAVVLGLSLVTKHILFLFPIWLYQLRLVSPERGGKYTPFLAYLLFGLSFLPFCVDSAATMGILHHVFGYNSGIGDGITGRIVTLLGSATIFDSRVGLGAAKALYFTVLTFSGRIWADIFSRQDDSVELLHIYLITLVAFSCSMADQYLAIPLIAIARYYRSPWAWIYTIVGATTVFGSTDNVLGARALQLPHFGYIPAQVTLLAFLRSLWRSSQSSQTSSSQTPRECCSSH